MTDAIEKMALSALNASRALTGDEPVTSFDEFDKETADWWRAQARGFVAADHLRAAIGSPEAEAAIIEGRAVGIVVVRNAETSELRQLEPGLFVSDGGFLGLKTEYPTQIKRGLYTYYYPDAYVTESGEYFWGGAKSHDERMLLPVNEAEYMRLDKPTVAKSATVHDKPTDTTPGGGV